MSKFYKLKVVDIQKVTDEASAIAFDVPYELYDTFNYKPGQYLTLQFNIKGENVRRSYSLCSSPNLEEPLRIGVKRVKDGLVSNYINDQLSVGDTVEIMPPDGRFIADVDAQHYKSYYLFAAGSGITPILSILRTVLYTEEQSHVYLFYGNRNKASIMFDQELEVLQQQYPERFVLEHTLSKAKSKWGLWSKSSDDTYRKGRIDAKAIQWFINEYPPYAQNAEYYICGPGTMIDNTKNALKAIDVPEDRIFMESFGGTIAEGPKKEGVANATLIAHLDGEAIEVTVPKGKTLLRTLIDQGKEPPFSCEGGVCSTCMCKLEKGQVHMINNVALDENDINEGYILSCQSIPLTEEVEIIYE